jgi:hypothetical protein
VEVTGMVRKLCSEELYNLYCSPNIIRVINENMGRTCNMEAALNMCKILVLNLNGSNQIGYLSIDCRIILK